MPITNLTNNKKKLLALDKIYRIQVLKVETYFINDHYNDFKKGKLDS